MNGAVEVWVEGGGGADRWIGEQMTPLRHVDEQMEEQVDG